MFKNKYFPFYLISFSILILLIIPTLIQDGMFMDGIQYAIVSKNLAFGKGTFWFPYLTDTWYKAGSIYFMEHPPLVYGIQAIFFKLFGSSIYTERIYSFTTAIISAFLIIKLWKISVKTKNKDLAFIPVVLWIIIPVVFWTYQNNLQENTLSIFALLSIINIILFTKNLKYINLIFAGLFIFLSAMCKGIPGLFPLTGFIAYNIAFKNKLGKKNTIKYSLILMLIIIVTFLLLMLNDTANKSINFYIFKRLLFRIDQEPTVNNRFYILYRLISELLLPLSIVFVSFIIFKIKKITILITKTDKQYFMFFLLIALSASIPLIITKVQRGFYLIPAFPFFALALSFLIKNKYAGFFNKIINNKHKYIITKYLSIFLFIFSVSFSVTKIGKISRNKDIINTVNKIGNNIPKGSIITTSKDIYNNWYLQFYLYRKYNISLNYNKKPKKYFLTSKNYTTQETKNLKKLNLNLTNYSLFVKNK